MPPSSTVIPTTSSSRRGISTRRVILFAIIPALLILAIAFHAVSGNNSSIPPPPPVSSSSSSLQNKNDLAVRNHEENTLEPSTSFSSSAAPTEKSSPSTATATTTTPPEAPKQRNNKNTTRSENSKSIFHVDQLSDPNEFQRQMDDPDNPRVAACSSLILDGQAAAEGLKRLIFTLYGSGSYVDLILSATSIDAAKNIPPFCAVMNESKNLTASHVRNALNSQTCKENGWPSGSGAAAAQQQVNLDDIVEASSENFPCNVRCVVLVSTSTSSPPAESTTNNNQPFNNFTFADGPIIKKLLIDDYDYILLIANVAAADVLVTPRLNELKPNPGEIQVSGSGKYDENDTTKKALARVAAEIGLARKHTDTGVGRPRMHSIGESRTWIGQTKLVLDIVRLSKKVETFLLQNKFNAEWYWKLKLYGWSAGKLNAQVEGDHPDGHKNSWWKSDASLYSFDIAMNFLAQEIVVTGDGNGPKLDMLSDNKAKTVCEAATLLIVSSWKRRTKMDAERAKFILSETKQKPDAEFYAWMRQVDNFVEYATAAAASTNSSTSKGGIFLPPRGSWANDRLCPKTVTNNQQGDGTRKEDQRVPVARNPYLRSGFRVRRSSATPPPPPPPHQPRPYIGIVEPDSDQARFGIYDKNRIPHRSSFPPIRDNYNKSRIAHVGFLDHVPEGPRDATWLQFSALGSEVKVDLILMAPPGISNFNGRNFVPPFCELLKSSETTVDEARKALRRKKCLRNGWPPDNNDTRDERSTSAYANCSCAFNCVVLEQTEEDPDVARTGYFFLQSLSFVNDPIIKQLCYEDYDYVLKGDLDLFYTPNFRKLVVPKGSIHIGEGSYVRTDPNTGRIIDDVDKKIVNAAERMNLRRTFKSKSFPFAPSKWRSNVGATWYGSPKTIFEATKLARAATVSLIDNEFGEVKFIPRAAGFPRFVIQVASMYGQEIAINHLFPDDKLLTGELDIFQQNHVASCSGSVVHAWQIAVFFNKMHFDKFNATKMVETIEKMWLADPQGRHAGYYFALTRAGFFSFHIAAHVMLGYGAPRFGSWSESICFDFPQEDWRFVLNEN